MENTVTMSGPGMGNLWPLMKMGQRSLITCTATRISSVTVASTNVGQFVVGSQRAHSIMEGMNSVVRGPLMPKKERS